MECPHKDGQIVNVSNARGINFGGFPKTPRRSVATHTPSTIFRRVAIPQRTGAAALLVHAASLYRFTMASSSSQNAITSALMPTPLPDQAYALSRMRETHAQAARNLRVVTDSAPAPEHAGSSRDRASESSGLRSSRK